MIVIVDERETVTEGYASWFDREGVSATGLRGRFRQLGEDRLRPRYAAVEAFLLGDCRDRHVLPRLIKDRTTAAVIAMNDHKCLDETLDLFAAGRRRRRAQARPRARDSGAHQSHPAPRGRPRTRASWSATSASSPMAAIPRWRRGAAAAAPRAPHPRVSREQPRRRVTKTQIFNFVYGLFGEDIDENVVESHISKLRKRLRHRLGYDPIDFQRYLGYRLLADEVLRATMTCALRASRRPDRGDCDSALMSHIGIDAQSCSHVPACGQLRASLSGSTGAVELTAQDKIMSLYGMMRTSASGMAAQSNRLGTVADNIANSNTTGYKRASTEFSIAHPRQFAARANTSQAASNRSPQLHQPSRASSTTRPPSPISRSRATASSSCPTPTARRS